MDKKRILFLFIGFLILALILTDKPKSGGSIYGGKTDSNVVITNLQKAEDMENKPEIKFTPENIKDIKKIIKNNEIVDGTPLLDHVVHCLSQLVRFARIAKEGKPFREAQFGFNLGRVTELLKSIGGRPCWWQMFEPLMLQHRYNTIIYIVNEYAKLFDITLDEATIIKE